MSKGHHVNGGPCILQVRFAGRRVYWPMKMGLAQA
jgi:hypothetical protein